MERLIRSLKDDLDEVTVERDGLRDTIAHVLFALVPQDSPPGVVKFDQDSVVDIVRAAVAERDRLREERLAHIEHADALDEVIVGLHSDVAGLLERAQERASLLLRAETAMGADGSITEDAFPDAIAAVVAERDHLRDSVARYKEFAESEILDRVSAELGADLRRQLEEGT
jgi:hypothetical protein